MPRVRVQQIAFGPIAFRKLANLTIPISERITVIAGHNGIGKSTILGLVANCSGLEGHTSYFNRTFQANMQDIISLSLKHDFVDDHAKKPVVENQYDIGGTVSLTKRCNTSRRGASGLRVVPRTDTRQPIEHDGLTFAADGKVPVPTIYLGMSRMIPFGESAQKDVESTRDSKIRREDAAYLTSIVNRLIDTGITDDPSITHQSIKHTRKSAKHPAYGYDARAVSLGQDSLVSIATALVSFKKLRDEMGPNYPGGMLIVDEIDAGFHPRTQIGLLETLKTEAKKLQLQVIVTTHSLTIIESVLKGLGRVGVGHASSDSVVYLQDTREPRYNPTLTLAQIQDDMHVRAPVQKPKARNVVKIYAEDDEALVVLKNVFDIKTKKRVKAATGHSPKLISAKMGCDDLMKLYRADDYFKTVVIVLDADGKDKIAKGQRNATTLPNDPNPSIRQNPEAILYSFCESLRTSPRTDHAEAWAHLAVKNVTSDYLFEHFRVPDININDRKEAKKWFNDRLDDIERLRLIKLWLREQSAATEVFINNVISIVKRVTT